MFELIKKEKKARLGVYKCSSGVVHTPVFMNVGTQAAIKGGLSAKDLELVGCQIELSNTYHLHLRPGDQIIKKLGGLHKFMGYNGPYSQTAEVSRFSHLPDSERLKRRAYTLTLISTAGPFLWGPKKACQFSLILVLT